MATKKTAKKAATKRPYNRKVETPVKKRAYNRKPIQPSADAQMELIPSNESLDQMVKQNDAPLPTNTQVLTEIDAIDIRGLDNFSKVLVLMSLTNEGYVSRSNANHLVNDTLTLGNALEAAGLGLNHNNKLVTFIYTGEEMEPGTAICTPAVIQQFGQIMFNRPQTHSDVIEQHGALYARIA